MPLATRMGRFEGHPDRPSPRHQTGTISHQIFQNSHSTLGDRFVQKLFRRKLHHEIWKVSSNLVTNFRAALAHFNPKGPS